MDRSCYREVQSTVNKNDNFSLHKLCYFPYIFFSVLLRIWLSVGNILDVGFYQSIRVPIKLFFFIYFTGDEFPGVYAVGLPETCWCEDNNRVIINSVWRTWNVALVINTSTKSVTRLPACE